MALASTPSIRRRVLPYIFHYKRFQLLKELRIDAMRNDKQGEQANEFERRPKKTPASIACFLKIKMTEFWVSQAKHYCKYCKCYIADNKPSLQTHESSIRHKQNVENLMKEKRNEKLHGAQSEADLKRQLAEIEKAARASMSSEGHCLQTAPPPPPYSFGDPAGRINVKPNIEDIGLEKEENSGIYTIRGVKYLDGRVFEHKLKAGVSCEIFVEALDDWFSGEITKRTENHVPNTTISFHTFDTKYTIPSADIGVKDNVVEEKNIKSDRIRLMISDPHEEEEEEEEENNLVHTSEPVATNVTVIDLNTGIGMWQTVTTREVDEEKETEEFEEARKAMVDEMNKAPQISVNFLSDSKADTGSYVPFHHVKEYKGHKIEEIMVSTTNKLVQDGSTVQFRKRKVTPEEPSGADVAESKEDNADASAKPAKLGISRPRNIRKRLEE